MRYGPPIAYARRRDGRRLAYQVVGSGDLDLVFLFGWPTHLGLIWEDPSFAGFLGKLSSFSRLILFDRLGDGLSDRGPTGHTFDDEMDDVRCVLAAAGSGRAAFFGCHTGGRLALLLAATHPDEVSAVVTFGSHPTTLRDDGYPWGSTPEERDEVFAAIRTLPPSEVADRLLAVLAQEFLTGAAPVPDPDRVLFTDIFDSTGLAAGMGDRRWHRVLVEHQEAVRRQLARFGGREVKTTGDGFLASFDGPARAIRSAHAIRAERGTHRLKGVPDSWQLYAVELAER
jgi:pimeloyl-ACP methyl ester carboxylesterase